MAALLADRVKETSVTSGTGAVTLAGAPTGFQAFSAAFAVGSQVYYAIVDATAGAWEIGIGTLTAATTLARTTVLGSSNAGAPVPFSANVKEVFCTMPASALVPGDGTGLLLKDASNGNTYRLYMSAGNLCVVQVS